MFLEIGTWQVSSGKKEKFLEVMRTFIAMQRSRRDEMLYKETKLYTKADDEMPVEQWMYIDVYESPEDCQKQWDLLERDTEFKEIVDNTFSQIVQDSFKTSHWIEQNELRIE